MDDLVAHATELVKIASRATGIASVELTELLYPELRRLAADRLRHEGRRGTLQTTALANEAWLRLVDQRQVDWRDRARFLAAAAVAIRRVLVDHARRRQAAIRGGKRRRVMLHEGFAEPGDETCGLDLLALHEALEDLAREHERSASALSLRFFAGMTVEETAHVLGVSPRTVKGDVAYGRAWLRRRLSRSES